MIRFSLPLLLPLASAGTIGTRSIHTGNHLVSRNDTNASLSTTGMPATWAAFGDSFSAGHGAGHWLTSSDQDNICARSDGSYPWQLSKFGFTDPITPLTNFQSCTGNVLSDTPDQQQQMGGKRVDMATLSISGNDFGFAEVVTRCVYPIVSVNPLYDYQGACNTALNDAKAKIADLSIWRTYGETMVNLFTSINTNGRIYITGYPQFFNQNPRTGDVCDGIYFLNTSIIGNNLKMTAANRQSMNDLVVSVNQNIKGLIADPAPSATFIDIDDHFEGHRFCDFDEDPAGRGVRANDVWINDLYTVLDEDGKWLGPPSNDAEAASWDAWAANIPADFQDPHDLAPHYRCLRDKYQQTSAFHPKTLGHKITAVDILWSVMHNAPASAVEFGPTKFCQAFGPGGETCVDVPANCGVIEPVQNIAATIICDNGTVIQ